MIHPSTLIHWIDINSEEVVEDTISSLFQKYSYLREDGNNKISTIDFSRINVKIQDLTGWTKIKLVKLFNVEKIDWYRIEIADKSIVISGDALIPIYDNLKPERGFHGEIKYPYTFKNPGKIFPCDNLRLYRGILNDNEIEFASPSTILNLGLYDNAYGYEVITQSRFFNANRIHMFGDDMLTIEEYEIMNKK